MGVFYRTDSYVIKAVTDKSDSIMVALKVPADAARLLALEDGQPAEDLHITLAYLGKRDEFTSEKLQTLHYIVSDIARYREPVEIEVTGYGVFPETDDGPCLHATVGMSQSLADLQEDVVEAVSSYGMPPQGKGQSNGKWVPHITLAYGESAPPPETPPVKDITFDWLRVALGGTEMLARLRGEAVTKAGEDGPGHSMTTANSPAGIIAPGQGVFRKPHDEKKDTTTRPGDGGGLNPIDVAGGKAFKPKPGTINPYESLFRVGKTVAIDFDGTITLDEKGTENPAVRDLVAGLTAQGVSVVIFTARSAFEVHKWLREHKWPSLEVTNIKSPDFGVYLDDRAVSFTPALLKHPDLADELAGFKTWWEKRAVGKAHDGKGLTPSQVLYMEDGDVKNCGRCMMFLKDTGHCSIHGPDLKVTKDDICGLYVHGEPITEAEHGPAMKMTTPGVSGFGKGNTKCGNCAWGGGSNCVHPNLSGFKIDNKGGCCNAWEKPGVEKAGTWNEADHPRAAAGTGEGGQFTAGAGGIGTGAGSADDKPEPATPGEDAGVDEDTAARAARWRANHPGERPEKPGGTAATDRTDEAAAWREEHEPYPDKPKVGDTMPGGGKIQPGDLEEPPKTSDTAAVLEEVDRLQAYRAGQGERPSDATLARWRDRGWIGPETVTPVTPTPADEPSREATPTEVSPEPDDFAPEEWDQLNDDQQNRARVAWINANYDDAVRDEQDYWRENQAPEDVMNDAEWNNKAVKELNEGYYPGESVAGLDDKGGGTPEQHAEQERRIAEWSRKFAMDESIAAGAFSVDNVAGKLEVDTNKLVFRDNPYAEDTGQQMLPGIDREMMSNAWKASQWRDVKADFENMYKEAFDKQVADMEPPDVGDQVRENMDDQWDAMNDTEKFRNADRAGIVVTPQGGGGSGEGMPAGTAGTVGPDKNDSPVQKKMQKISDEIAEEKNLGGGISTTKIWIAKDGSKWVWKPSTGEADSSTHGRSGIEAGEQYQRETAAYDIGAAVGMKDIMPAVAIVKHEGEYGAMMQMIPNAHNGGDSDDAGADSAHLETARRGTVLDYVIGNTDRHGKNWMTDSKGKRWLIDHGLSFSESSGDSPRYGMFDKEAWDQSEVIPESIKKGWRNKWEKMKTIMHRRGISEHAIEKVEERYTHLMEDGVTWKDVFEKGAF